MELPLKRIHAELGGRVGTLPGDLEAVLDYGDPADEYAALTTDCGLVDRSGVGRRELLGRDRQRLVHGLVTCEVKALGPGDGAYGFFTGPQGKVLADAVLLAHDDRLWLELPAGLGKSIGEHIKKYVVVDDVEVLPVDDMLPLTVAGPSGAKCLAPLVDEGELPAAEWSHRRIMLAGVEVCAVAEERFGVPSWTLWTSASVAPGLVEDLVAAGIRPVGFAALETARIVAGVPRFGPDFGPENLPQETGLESAVSYEKGCYLGQEVVARLHYRGQASRVIRRLDLAGVEPPEPGTEVLLEDRPAGTVTSVAAPPTGAPAAALAMLQRRAAEPGTRVRLPGGEAAVLGE